MRVRTFRVGFDRLVGADAVELEFDADTDYLMVRPIWGQSASYTQELSRRMLALGKPGPDDETEDQRLAREKADEAASEALVLELMEKTIVEWHLVGPDGEAIPRPRTAAEVNDLPAGLAGAFFRFISTYRGDAPNPTTPA